MSEDVGGKVGEIEGNRGEIEGDRGERWGRGRDVDEEKYRMILGER